MLRPRHDDRLPLGDQDPRLRKARRLLEGAPRAPCASDWAGREDLRLLMANKTPKLRQRRRPGRRASRNASSRAGTRPSTAGARRGAGPTTSTSCPRPATCTSASRPGRRPTAGALARPSPTGPRRPRARTARARPRWPSRSPRSTLPGPAAPCSTSASCPQALEGEEGIDKLSGLVRTYFRLGGHHIQFNVVDTADPARGPEAARGLPQPPRAGSRLLRLLRRPRHQPSGRNYQQNCPRRILGQFCRPAWNAGRCPRGILRAVPRGLRAAFGDANPAPVALDGSRGIPDRQGAGKSWMTDGPRYILMNNPRLPGAAHGDRAA